MVENLEEEFRITSPPGVDRLLGVAHVEERTLATAVLDHLVDEGSEHLPLHPARVLELVEEPVIELCIESIPGARHPVETPDLGGEKVGDIGEGHPSATAGQRVVGCLERLHEAPQGGALFQERFVDRPEQGEQKLPPEFGNGSPQVDAPIGGTSRGEVLLSGLPVLGALAELATDELLQVLGPEAPRLVVGGGLEVCGPLLAGLRGERGMLLQDLRPERVGEGFDLPGGEDLAAGGAPDQVTVSPREFDIFEELLVEVPRGIEKRPEDLPLPSPSGNAPHLIEELRTRVRGHGFAEDRGQGLRARPLQLRFPDHRELPRKSRLQGEGSGDPRKEAVDRPHGQAA